MRYFFLIIAVLLPVISEAQISAPGMNAVRYTSYPSAPGVKNPIFIFCNAGGTEKGTLTAVHPNGSGVYNFSWFGWNDVDTSFSNFIKTDPGVVSSSIINLNEGGYKVEIDSAGIYDTSLVGWIFLDKPYSFAKLKNRTCDYVALTGQAAIDTFNYNDPFNGNNLKLPNGISFLWSSDPVSTIPFPDYRLDPQTFDPPLVDVTYKLVVSDSFGCISESSFLYESIHVKAEFSVEPDKGEAPLEVNFTDKSIRGFKYKWEFGDGDTTSLNNPEQHIYYKPGEYSVKLTIESDLHCVDSMRFDKIVIEPSELKIPNVFTPDGDTFNDHFIVESKSLRYINVEVFSRSGMKVYAFYGEGESLREWQGWDGNINNSSIKASPGVYFYIIRAYGWDDVDYNSKEYRGFVYLYR